jgi:hypothetical protein
VSSWIFVALISVIVLFISHNCKNIPLLISTTDAHTRRLSPEDDLDEFSTIPRLVDLSRASVDRLLTRAE